MTKSGPTIGTQGHKLAINDRVIRDILPCCRDARKSLGEHVLPAGVECSFAATTHNFQPIAVQLYLIGPFRAVWQPGDRKAVHRLDESGEPCVAQQRL
jgi:hypothetical protein